MKKIVFLVIILDLFLINIAYERLKSNYVGDGNELIVETSSMIMQSTITGAVTFIGLYLTCLSQDMQDTRKERMELCPCIVVKDSLSPSVIKDENSISKNQKIIICSNMNKVRTVTCSIMNCKKNYVLNLSIRDKNGNREVGTIINEIFTLELALNAENKGELIFEFQNIYGLKYKQKIIYEYQSGIKNYYFISNQPKRKIFK